MNIVRGYTQTLATGLAVATFLDTKSKAGERGLRAGKPKDRPLRAWMVRARGGRVSPSA